MHCRSATRIRAGIHGDRAGGADHEPGQPAAVGDDVIEGAALADAQAVGVTDMPLLGDADLFTQSPLGKLEVMGADEQPFRPVNRMVGH